MNSFAKPELSDYEDIAEQVALKIGAKEPLTVQFLRAAITAARVFDHKQGKYGPGNIAKFGEMGVMVRASDKIERMANLHRTEQEPADETRDDTWGDVANYGLIALMCRWGWWPGVAAAQRPEA
jgi:hypothetical protein